MATRKQFLLFLAVILPLLFAYGDEENFDVRKHLSTVSRYDFVKDLYDKNFVPTKIPDECRPIHLNLVARHGTRSPTKKRLRELEKLSTSLEEVLSSLKSQKGGDALKKIPEWLKSWQSPWKGKKKGGELVKEGEDELYGLGVRVRERFEELFKDEYHPDIITIKSTQVPRASASAVAFGMGLFNGKGSLGPGQHRAFAVISESRASDIWLRFHDTCERYGDYRKHEEPSVKKLKEPTIEEVSIALSERYQLNITRQLTASLWFLCKQEASLLNITDQACGLFTPSEVSLLEWTDDLEGFILKGYGNPINYRMGVPLLEDTIQSMERAITAKEEKQSPGSYEKARLRFAHAETIVPFSCLLGLFLDGDEYTRIQKEQALESPPRPPQKRSWRGNTVAPFAGNNMLVLYNCPSDNKYFVQVLHNEVPVGLPGCGYSDFCPFEDFKEHVVNPHLRQNYDSICKIPQPEPGYFSKLYNWFYPGSCHHGKKSEL
ncbi:hypothetical protein ACHQM5_002297 [Ranunculus cassubicifolius]